MVRLNPGIDGELYEYPLKLVRIEDFFANSDELLWRKASKSLASLRSVHRKINTFQKDQFSSYYTRRNESTADDDAQAQEVHIEARHPRLANTDEVTLFFVDSDMYHNTFENSNIKLIKNIVILNR